MIFSREYTIGLEDIGYNNVASNKSLIQIMENVGALHSSLVGYGFNEIETTRKAWVILDWKVNVYRRPKYNETITANTWAVKMDRVCAYRDFEIKDKEGNQIAIGTSRWIYLNIDTRRPERLSSEMVEKFKAEPDRQVYGKETDYKDLEEINKIIEEDQKEENAGNEKPYEYKVQRRDIDINMHMHNLYYLDIANEVLPDKVYFGIEPNYIRINYKKEILYGDKINCKYIKNKDRHIVYLLQNNTVHAVIVLSNK